MKDEKVKEQLINQLAELRQRIAELEALEAQHKQAEETLRESEATYRSLYSSMSEGVCLHEVIYDESGEAVDYRILDVNPSYELITGLSREEAVGRKASELYGTGKPPYMEVYAKAAATGQPASFETYFQPMDKHFSISVFSPFKGQFATVFTDITKRKKAEEALRESEKRLINAQRIAHMGSWDWDITTNELFWSDEIYRIFGLNPQEFGATYDAFLNSVHPDDRESVQEHVNMAVHDGAEYSIDHRIVLPGGEVRYVHEQGEVTQDESGTPVRMLGTVIDITELKSAEEQLRRQSAVLEAINNVFQETLTCESREEVANTCLAVAEDLTGSKFGFIGEVNQAGRFDTIALSDPGWDACRIPKSNAVVMVKDMEIRGVWGEVIKHGKSVIANDPPCHPDSVGTPQGHPQLTSFLGVPLRYAGKTIGMIALANKPSGYDPSDQEAVEALSVSFVEAMVRMRKDEQLAEYREDLERKVAERTQELEVANASLRKADRLKSEFLANMSHELRTPLNAIIGFAEILRDGICGELNEDQMTSVVDIHDSGRHLLQMINDILDLSKIEAGKMELQPEEFSIARAIDDVQSIVREMVSKKRLSLQVGAPEDLPDVYADLVKFKQVMYNLLSNAVKFTPEGGSIDIHTSLDDEFLISVTDTGIGIDPKDQEAVFDEFKQLASDPSQRHGGTGLGLALTRRLVELHGGTIWVESEGEGKGSRFSFTLPVRRPDAETRQKALRELPSTVRVSDHPMRKTILLVEDNVQAAQLLCIYLAEAGYNTVVATDGDEAIKMAQEVKPFAITLDIMLPEKDGWQVMQELKSLKDTRDIPVIIVSVVDDQNLGFSMGAAGYLVKPIDKEQLMHVLDKLECAAKTAGARPRILIIDDNPEDLRLMKAMLQGEGYDFLEASDGTLGVSRAIEEHPDLIILDLLMPGVNGFDVVRSLQEHPDARNIPIIVCTMKELTNEDREILNNKVKSIVQKGEDARTHLLEAVRRIEQFQRTGQS